MEETNMGELSSGSKRQSDSLPPANIQGTPKKVPYLLPAQGGSTEVAEPSYPLNYNRGRIHESDPWIPQKLRVSDYQCGLALQFVEAKRIAAKAKLVESLPYTIQLENAAHELGLEPVYGTMPSINPDKPLVTVELPNTHPSLLFIESTREKVAEHMVRYLHLNLINPPWGEMTSFRKNKKSQNSHT